MIESTQYNRVVSLDKNGNVHFMGTICKTLEQFSDKVEVFDKIEKN